MASQEAIELGALDIHTKIQECLDTKKGCIIGRNGTIELSTLLSYIEYGSFQSSQTQILEQNAGIFPQSTTSLKQWADEYLQANKDCDIIAAGWYKPLEAEENTLLDKINPSVCKIPLRSLEPYYVSPEKRWTNLLAGKKVCVVNSFTDTMKMQIDKRSFIWKNGDVESLLPSSTLFSFIKTGYPPSMAQGRAEWPYPNCDSWVSAVNSMYDAVLQTEAQIVLIGCGGLGFPLAQRLKQAGKIIIVLGGAIQVLFGIKGSRWKKHGVISTFWNDAWVYPSISETPKSASSVEGACYWSNDAKMRDTDF